MRGDDVLDNGLYRKNRDENRKKDEKEHGPDMNAIDYEEETLTYKKWERPVSITEKKSAFFSVFDEKAINRTRSVFDRQAVFHIEGDDDGQV
ncbi:MAG: hypothetical protein K6C41_03060 [Lachnospiraceae bacterium]|nr:hypothetical protein [Lachnospiraceae bacterium]